MKQKIIKIGNSTGVIIPKPLLEELDLHEGSIIMVEKGTDKQSISLSKDGPAKKSSVTPEFLERLDKLTQKYAPALKELADK
jgi:putative addiction module antidote